jgi:CRP/FNR family transcriptional regulator
MEGTHFYILISGTMRIFKTSYDGNETTVKIINPGEIFGEVILFSNQGFPASAMAISSCEVFAIHKDSFSRMLDGPDARNRFIASLFGKLRYLSDRVHLLASYDVEERFFRFLLNNYGKKYEYDITIPKKDLASAIGTIPETFSRLILRLAKLGIISWEGQRLTVKKGFWEHDIWEE